MTDKYDAFLDAETDAKYDSFLDEPTLKTKPAPAKTVPYDKYGAVADEQSFFENLLAGAGGAAEGWKIRLQQLLGRSPTDAEIADYQAAVAALRKTGGGLTGEILANLMPGIGATKAVSAIPIAASTLAKGGIAGLGAGVGVGAATGALEGAMIPTRSDESSAENIVKTSLYGGAGAGVAGAVAGAGKVVADAVGPFFSRGQAQAAGGRILNTAVGDQSPAIISQLRNPPASISPQNAAQAAVNAASPELSATQRLVDRLNPKPGADLATNQAQGRQALIGTFAKDEAALTAAEAARKANNNITAILAQPVKADKELVKILRDPYAKATLDEVRKLIEAAQLRGGKKIPLGEQLQMIKKELDKALEGSPMGKPSDNQTRAILAVQDDLLAWMRKNIPGYEKSMEKYAEDSSKIFQMKGGQAIQAKLAKPVGEGESPTVLANAIRQETPLIKSAGGMSRKSLEDQFTPANYAKIEQVLAELDTNATVANLASKGASSTTLQSAVGNAIQLPNLMNSAVAITNGLIQRVMGAGKLKSMKELSAIMQDPKTTADIMEKATAREKNAIRFLMRTQQGAGALSTAIAETQQ